MQSITMKKRSWSKTGMLSLVVLSIFFVLIRTINLSLRFDSYCTRPLFPGIKTWTPKQDNRSPLTLIQSQDAQISCDRSHYHYDLCKMDGPTLLNPTTSTFSILNPTISNQSKPHIVEKIRPYPRKWENFTMSRIKELALTSQPSLQEHPIKSERCIIKHNCPALVFSAGGYTGNFFHEFNDGFIPLFITVNSIFINRSDFVLVVSKARDWWVNKYIDLLQGFTNHPIIDLDNDNSTHCFDSVTVGLISHGFMTIDQNRMPNSRTLINFHNFLGKIYGFGLNHQPKSQVGLRPQLVLVSRTGNVGRVIVNQNKIKEIAEEIGFDVVIFEPKVSTPLHEAYGLINSSHAMVGVHGAALTHFLFLRPGAVFGQVVPIGINWAADICFGKPAREMGLQYIEYKIGVKESTLIDDYNRDDIVIKDPVAFQGKNWSGTKLYLEQNVRLELNGFKKYLERVYVKAREFMVKEK